MVDFQSRERRTRDRDDEDDGESDEKATGEETTSSEETRATSQDGVEAGVAVVTVSDEQTVDEDAVGDAVVESLGNHTVVTRELLNSDHDSVQRVVNRLVGRNDVDAVVTVGGAGIGQRDVTVEAVHPLFEKVLPGFGELFRRQYYEAVGTDVITSRATAGIADATPVFCLSGTVEAARIGTGQIISEQIGQLVDDDSV
jgi:molybdenum cofactor biosynthesis protein B